MHVANDLEHPAVPGRLVSVSGDGVLIVDISGGTICSGTTNAAVYGPGVVGKRPLFVGGLTDSGDVMEVQVGARLNSKVDKRASEQPDQLSQRRPRRHMRCPIPTADVRRSLRATGRIGNLREVHAPEPRQDLPPGQLALVLKRGN